jgi:WD40 repeat protein
MGAVPSTLTKAKPLNSEQLVTLLRQQNAQLQAKVSELEARLLALDAPRNPDATFAKCSTGVINGRNRRNEQFLRDLFNRHKDARGRLSGQNLVQALREIDAPHIPTSEQEIADLINQFDANSNAALDFGEFQQVVNQPDELEIWLSEKQLPLAADAIRPLVGRSNQLQKMSQLSSADIDQCAAATSFMPAMLKELHQELCGAFAVQSNIQADMQAAPSKFNDFYKMASGNIDDFHKGLTGRVGMPHLKFLNAMRQEHCERAGCDVEFTTSNYNITTTPKKEWRYIVENAPGRDMRHERRHMSISELVKKKISQDAHLREEEVIAIVLYTGPMFQIYNTILRRYPEDKFAIFRDGDNLFSTTIFVLVSAVQKLSRFTRIPLGTLLYRGLGGKVDLPDIFYQVDDKGCSGYAEWGFLSTTSECDVALGYSGVTSKLPKAMVMVIETSSIDRGADISEYSQYPGEKEFLYLPCSFVQRTKPGNGRIQVVDGGLVTFVSVKVNLNMKTQTLEELQEQKKCMHMVSARSMVAEVKYELTEWMRSLPSQSPDISNFVSDTIKSCSELFETHDRRDASIFAEEQEYRQMINEVLDTKANVEKAKLLMNDTKMRGATRATLVGHNGWVSPVAFHPTAPILATGSVDKTLKLWSVSLDNPATNCVATLEGHAGWVCSVAFHRTAPILATGSHDKTMKLWRHSPDFSAVTCAATLEGHGNSVLSVAFHPTAPVLASGSSDGKAKLWRLSPDNSAATCVADLEGQRTDENCWICCVTFHPTAPILATGSRDQTAKLWRLSPDHSSATLVLTLEGHQRFVHSVVFHPTEPLLATGSADKTAKLWCLSPDFSAATCAAALDHNGWVHSVAFHPTARILATGSGENNAKLWRFSPDMSAVTCVASLKGHGNTVRSVAFHPTAPLLATGSDDKTARLWG